MKVNKRNEYHANKTMKTAQIKNIPGAVATADSSVSESWRNYSGETLCQHSSKNTYDRKYLRHCEIDFIRFPVVVLESDDWGCCSAKLESVEDLERLFKLLESICCRDGLPPVCTAFTCVSNPDFEAIQKNQFTRYCDLSLDEGFPAPWQGQGIVEKMCEGMKRGVWRPEYHALLHHVSPRLWLQLLRGTGKASDIARERFQKSKFAQPSHLPEYEGYTVREQIDMIGLGLNRFKRLFGFEARAAVTSDAYPETVVLWAACGIDAVALVNRRLNDGIVTVYHTKSWNFQDIYAKLGDFGASTGVAYLVRNASFENQEKSAVTFSAVTRAWEAQKEAAVISCHRYNLLDSKRLLDFKKLLMKIADAGAVFATSGELRDLYHHGWFVRAGVLHKYAEVPCPYKKGKDIASGKEIWITPKVMGNFLISVIDK